MSAATDAINASRAYSPTTDDTSARVPQKELGQDDFLKILVTQLTTQDPLSPSGDLNSIAQMASFTSLDQTRLMVADLAKLSDDQDLLKANALIGRTVSVQIDADTRQYGVVTSVQVEAGKPKVVVDGQT